MVRKLVDPQEWTACSLPEYWKPLNQIIEKMVARERPTPPRSDGLKIVNRTVIGGEIFVVLRGEIPAKLSPRQRQVALLAGQGQSNEGIAQTLRITPSTVASHLRSVFWKLGVTSRAELARKALLLE